MLSIKEIISEYVCGLVKELHALNSATPKKIGFFTRFNGKKMRAILLLEHEKNLIQKHLMEMCMLSIDCVENSKSYEQYVRSYDDSQQKYQLERRKIYDELSILSDDKTLPVDKLLTLH